VPAYEHLKGGPDKVADGKTPDGKPIDGKATEPKVDKAAAEKAKADAEAAKALEKIDGMIKEGKLEEADKELDAILNTQATNGKAWYLKGTLAEKKGALDDASVCYRQAASLKEAGAEDNLRRISESRVKPLLDEADKMLSEKKQVEAVELYREAARMAPNLVSVQRKLLDMLKQMGESKEADKVQKKLDELEKAK
jgi:Flp pilus assembly protein TadD